MNFKKLATISLFALIFTNSFAEGGDPAKGKALSAICAACHNADGNSINPIWPKLAGQHGAYIVKQLQDFKEGKRVNAQMSGMVATLSNEDMPDLGAYYASQKTKQGSAKPELIDLGQNIYRSGDSQAGIPACMACHGPNGKGNPGALYPSLSGQHAEYTATQLKLFKAEERNNDVNGVMRAVAGPMTNAQIEAVAEYIQGLH